MVTGQVHSIETMGLVDGPGMRTVFFLQGCPIRCAFCHNPDTQTTRGGQTMSPLDVLKLAQKYKSFHGLEGGVTFSGGEPMLQGAFLRDCVQLLKKEGFHICVDTSGFGDPKYYSDILPFVDIILLDIKAFEATKFYDLVKGKMSTWKFFIDGLDKNGFRGSIWVRHVMVPGYTDSEESMRQFVDCMDPILNKVEKIEILPYHTMGIQKYKELNRPYLLEGVPAMDRIKAKDLERLANRLFIQRLRKKRQETKMNETIKTSHHNLTEDQIQSLKDHLARIDLFRDLHQEGLNEVLDHLKFFEVLKDEYVFKTGDSFNYMYVICKGHIKIYNNTLDGREQIFYIYNENDFVGGHNLFSKTNYLYMGQAIEDCLIAAIPFEYFERYMVNNPTVLHRILEKSFERIRWAENLIARLSTTNASMKVANLLIRLSELFGQKEDDGICVDLSLNREELGSYSGLTRETITRKLGEFKDLGYIDIISNKKIVIKDLSALKKYIY